MTNRVFIAGAGMVTSVGLSAIETFGSVRSGVSRIQDTDIPDRAFQPVAMGVAADEALPPLAEAVTEEAALTPREKRQLRLAAKALEDLLSSSMSLRLERVPLLVGWPEDAGPLGSHPDRLQRCLGLQTGHALGAQGFQLSSGGRAAGMLALCEAHRRLQVGEAEVLVAGGVDTYLDVLRIAALDHQQRVKSDSSRDGFIPGEGAAFLLLMTESFAQSTRAQRLAEVVTSGTGFESGHLYSDDPCRGEGLSQALDGVFSRPEAGARQVEVVYASMNGENHWAKEWGVAYIRHRRFLREDYDMRHTAEFHGDPGAAAGPISTGIAATGFSLGSGDGATLIYSSSDHGDRAALLLHPLR